MSDSLTHEIIRTIVARILLSKNFSTASESSLDILVDAVIKKACDISQATARRSTHCGRTISNIYDVIFALDEIGMPIQYLMKTLNEDARRPTVKPYEYLISPYPIKPSCLAFNKKVYQNDKQVVPFRANSSIRYFAPVPQNENRHIPPFFMEIPDPVTYNENEAPDKQTEEENKTFEDFRERDQKESKEVLAQLNKSNSNVQDNQKMFELDLIEIPTIKNPAGKWDGKDETPLMVKENKARVKLDPEFIAEIYQTPSKDQKEIKDSKESKQNK